MSDSTERSVDTGALSRKPDVSRLIKRNRPAAAAVAFPPADQLPEAPEVVNAGVDTSADATGEGVVATTPQAEVPIPAETVEARPATPTTMGTPKAPKSAEATTAKKTMTVYIGGDVRRRARAAFQATSYQEQDSTWSDFVEKAILEETQRRERKHNGGKPFAGGEQRLTGGRPFKDD
jgi:hypothetical protein